MKGQRFIFNTMNRDMDLEKAKNYLLSHDWYCQSAGAKVIYISFPMKSIFSMRIFGERIPIGYDIKAYLGEGIMNDYITKQSLVEVALYYWEKQQKDQNFIYKLEENCQKKYVVSLLACDGRVRKTNFEKLSNDNFLEIFQDFSEKYFAFWQEMIFLDSYDYAGEALLNKVLGDERGLISNEDLATLLAPVKVSFLQKERLAVLKLAQKIEKNEALRKDCLEKGHALVMNKNLWLEKELKAVSQKFHWIENDYAVFSFLESEYFFKKVLTLLTERDKMEVEIRMFEEIRDIENKKKIIASKNHLSKKFIEVADYFAQLGSLRDQRKSYNQLCSGTIEIFAKEFSQRSGIGLQQVEQLFYDELAEIFSSDLIVEKSQKRLGGFFYFPDKTGEKISEFYGNSARQLNALIRSGIGGKLSGRVAFMGKKGGIAKIIRDKRDFYKMEKGDILIAPNTRPEYVPIMKIAGAIVTEEGGITCHAAIVSRELKIPCIVGVQGVTNALKDGDLVEVDAVRGIIIRRF